MLPNHIIYILVTVAVFIFGYRNFFYKNAKKIKENLFLRLSKEGTANNLIFCSQEILQNKVIGIDGIQRKIMILEKIKNKYNCSVISLDEVQNCELITSCRALYEDNFNKFEVENLHAIELRFQFKNQAQPASIIFYESLINSQRELVLLKAKAEYWCVMLSKLLTKQVSAGAMYNLHSSVLLNTTFSKQNAAI